jgi:hypothetical protein
MVSHDVLVAMQAWKNNIMSQEMDPLVIKRALAQLGI